MQDMDTTYRLVALGDSSNVGQTAATPQLAKLVPGNLYREGNRLGITSTPTVYIDGKKLPQINYFVAIVDKEARKKGSPPLAQAGH